MADSNSERQARYRAKVKSGETRRFQITLPLEIGIKADYLCEALQCNKTELFSRLLMEEWQRQGEPVK